MLQSQLPRLPKLTIFGRSLLLITLELFANALLWVAAGILFGRDDNTRPVLNLALLAWVRIPNCNVCLQSLNAILRHLV